MNNQPPTKSITIRAWRSLTTAIKATAAKSFSFGGGLGTVGFGSGARSVGGVELRDLTHRADEMDYGKMLGDVWDSSIMSIVLNWFWRTFPEAPCVVQRRNEDDRWAAEHDHPLVLLLNHPHDFFTPSQLWDMILLGYMLNGNAYLLKNRNAAGEVVELIPIPHWQIEPWWEEGDYITAYRYFPAPSGTETFTDFSPRDIIHFKNGFDPNNWRKGLAPWRAQKVLLVTDKECDFYESTVLHNRGLPSVVITPADNSTFIDKDNSEKIKTMWIARTTGKERGKPLVLSDPFKLQELGLNPTQMMVDKLRQPSETRVSAAYGIPSAILGLMAGIENSTLANVQTWWTYSYLSGIMPLQRRLAETLTFHLLSEFIPAGDLLTKPGIHIRVAFDTSEVYALQQQKDDLYQRNAAGFRGGVLKRSEARSNLVLKVDRAREDVYIEDVMPQQLGLGPGHSDTVSGAASGTQPTNGTHGGDGVPASQKAIMDLMGSLK